MRNSQSSSELTTTSFHHIPVMAEEVVAMLNLKSAGIYVDATVGGAGHAIRIAKVLQTLDHNQNNKSQLICFDRDPDAVEAATNRLKDVNIAKVMLSEFSKMKQQLAKLNIFSVDGVLMDLGVSSFQLDNANRGFSHKKIGQLDMRMSKKGISAFDVVNGFEKNRIAKILRDFGDEKFANLIAAKIAIVRQKAPIQTTTELAQIVKLAVPAKFRRQKNPCKKTFQAIRIAVNDEITELQQGLDAAFELLKPQGRLIIISFHSLEDKLVKHSFLELSKGCICPPKTPFCICNNKPKAQILNKKPLLPSDDEILRNPRCKSAKLRALKKL